jgi:hypothetical protein
MNRTVDRLTIKRKGFSVFTFHFNGLLQYAGAQEIFECFMLQGSKNLTASNFYIANTKL